ncbi:hypothetical protein [Microbulbifer sp.]|uniref:hypothetical protein n=1 Tax=Microbulbifer sp. TaxID=1908541 RepID=UPI003F343F84
MKTTSLPSLRQGGVIFGDGDSLNKCDAEQFPDELEEYTLEERRRLLRLHKGQEEKGEDD